MAAGSPTGTNCEYRGAEFLLGVDPVEGVEDAAPGEAAGGAALRGGLGIACIELAEGDQGAGLGREEGAALKLLYPALTKITAEWETAQHWKYMLIYLQTHCTERIAESGYRT